MESFFILVKADFFKIGFSVTPFLSSLLLGCLFLILLLYTLSSTPPSLAILWRVFSGSNYTP